MNLVTQQVGNVEWVWWIILTILFQQLLWNSWQILSPLENCQRWKFQKTHMTCCSKLCCKDESCSDHRHRFPKGHVLLAAYSFMLTQLLTISDVLTEVSIRSTLFSHFCTNPWFQYLCKCAIISVQSSHRHRVVTLAISLAHIDVFVFCTKWSICICNATSLILILGPQVLCWFSLYLHYKAHHPLPWNPGSDTAELCHAIFPHPDIKSAKWHIVVDHVCIQTHPSHNSNLLNRLYFLFWNTLLCMSTTATNQMYECPYPSFQRSSAPSTLWCHCKWEKNIIKEFERERKGKKKALEPEEEEEEEEDDQEDGDLLGKDGTVKDMMINADRSNRLSHQLERNVQRTNCKEQEMCKKELNTLLII